MMGYRTALISLAVGMFTAFAASAAEGDIDYRKATMAAIGSHVKASATIIQGKVPHKADLKAHAAALRDLALSIEHIFPADSAKGDTKAKADIWEKKAEFDTVRMAFVTATEGFLAAAGGQDVAAVGPAFAKVGDACKGCHSKFRN